MQDRIEVLERARRRMLAGFLVAFVAWQLPVVAEELLVEEMAPGIVTASRLVGVVAAVVWMVYSLRLWRLQRLVSRDPEAATALDDERVRQVRARSLGFGFWTLIVYLVAVRLGAFLVALPAAAVAQLGFVVAAASVIGAFLVYDRG